MTNTTPLNEEAEEILRNRVKFIGDGEWTLLGTPNDVLQELTKLIQTLEKKARIDEISSWFDLPKHYPGEEYRDEPFAKVKCKTPGRVQYYTLDSRFTYALLTRLKELSSAEHPPNNTTTRSGE